MNNKLKPALLGGLIVGVFSAIHSLIPIISLCCCIWSIIGGVLAALLYAKSSPKPVPMGDGAMVGALAGVVGGIIYVVIYLPIALLWGMATMQEQLNRSGVHLPFSGTILMIVGSLIGAVALVVLSTLGGVIGTAIFGKGKGTSVAPPPPQNFGGPGI
ncbi:MAG TPA: hypothetical protein DC047_02480 [Blastocatellia bacterium]|nr:hypothetical protein [Blastocatellia bacterium]